MSFITQNLMGKLFSKRKKSDSASRPQPAVNACGDNNAWSPTDVAPLLHNDAVVSVSSIQPGYCISGGKDGCVILYDYNNKKQEERWTGDSGAVTKVSYGRACDAIFSSSRDKTVKMWRRGCSGCMLQYKGHDLVVTAIHINADGTLLCSGSRDNTVRLWDVETAACIKSNSIPQNLVTDVKFVPGSSLIAQSGEDKEIRIFDSRTLHPVFSFPKKQHIQMCCDVSTDGNHIISCSSGFSGAGCEATLWDLRNRKLQLEYRGHHEAIEACLFLPCSEHPLVATASRDCSVNIWNMYTGACETQCFISGSGPLTSLAAYEDGSILVGSFNLGVQVLKLLGGSLTKLLQY